MERNCTVIWKKIILKLKYSYEFVDAVAMRLVQWPNSYDVLITENLFGDILTDEASVISGSMGLMPSASVGSKTSLYEPIHGSYPQASREKYSKSISYNFICCNDV